MSRVRVMLFIVTEAAVAPLVRRAVGGVDARATVAATSPTAARLSCPVREPLSRSDVRLGD